MLLSHPRGLFYLAVTEGWERFSRYGMVALISLYMGNQLVLPGSVEHIAGFASLRAALERLSGPLSTQAFASQIFGALPVRRAVEIVRDVRGDGGAGDPFVMAGALLVALPQATTCRRSSM